MRNLGAHAPDKTVFKLFYLAPLQERVTRDG